MLEKKVLQKIARYEHNNGITTGSTSKIGNNKDNKGHVAYALGGHGPQYLGTYELNIFFLYSRTQPYGPRQGDVTALDNVRFSLIKVSDVTPRHNILAYYPY